MFVAVLTVVGMLISDLAARLARSAHPHRRAQAMNEPTLTLRPATTSIRAPFDPGATEPIGAGERGLLPRLVVAADVVEVPPPQGGGRLGAHPARLLRRGAVRRGHRALQPDQAPRRIPLRAAAGACICSTRAASSGPFVYPYKFTFDIETLPPRLRRRPHEAAAAPLLLPRRRLRVLGPDRTTDFHLVLPARRTARCSCSAPTGSGATCSRASSTARGSR